MKEIYVSLFSDKILNSKSELVVMIVEYFSLFIENQSRRGINEISARARAHTHTHAHDAPDALSTGATGAPPRPSSCNSGEALRVGREGTVGLGRRSVREKWLWADYLEGLAH